MVSEGGICNSNVESWFLRSEENREKQAMKNRGGKDQPGRDGHGERVVASIPLMINEVDARYSPKWRRARINFLPPLKTLYRVRKVSKPWYFDFTPDLKKLRQLRCFSRSSLLTIQSFTKEPWEGGRGGSRFRFSPPPRDGSVHRYVYSRVASLVGFSRILELRF